MCVDCVFCLPVLSLRDHRLLLPFPMECDVELPDPLLLKSLFNPTTSTVEDRIKRLTLRLAVKHRPGRSDDQGLTRLPGRRFSSALHDLCCSVLVHCVGHVLWELLCPSRAPCRGPLLGTRCCVSGFSGPACKLSLRGLLAPEPSLQAVNKRLLRWAQLSRVERRPRVSAASQPSTCALRCEARVSLVLL